MNRKNTILIAVLINAGLLLVLFITAITSSDEVSSSSVIAASQMKQEIPAPLFGEEIHLNSKGEVLQSALSQVAPVASLPASPEAPSLVHPLPPLAVSPTPEVPVAVQAAPVLQPQVAAAPSLREVTVKKGDSLEKIAKISGVSVDQIIKINHLSSSFLRVGQVIKIPGEKTAVASVKQAPSSKGEYYTVKVGDNPWTIAMKHHLKVEELLKMNGLNEERAKKLKPGDRLRIKN